MPNGVPGGDLLPAPVLEDDARAAFEKGALDAWGIWDPYYAAAEIDGRARVLTTGQGLSSNNSFYLGSRELTRQPALVKGLFAALSQADAWCKANLPQTARFLSDATGVPLAGTIRFLDRRSSGAVTVLKPADIADQQRVADAFSRAGLIPKPLKVADAVWQPGSPFA